MSSKAKKYILSILLAFLGLPRGLEAQTKLENTVRQDTNPSFQDTLREVKPGKAALYSTIFPGGGQIYNRKYWKLPIIYVALGTATYAAIWNNQQSKIYLDAFYEQTDPNNSNPSFGDIYTESQLIELYYQHRRWQDMSIIIGALLYGLQILDAYVDAHLYHYDISDDISLRWQPSILQPAYSPAPVLGIGLSFSFK